MSVFPPPDWETVYQWQRRAAVSAVAALLFFIAFATTLALYLGGQS